MKITSYRKTAEAHSQRTLGMETVVKDMQNQAKAKAVNSLREILRYYSGGSRLECVEKLPVLVFGGVFKKNDTEQELTTYNGIVILEINKLTGIKEATNLRNYIHRIEREKRENYCALHIARRYIAERVGTDKNVPCTSLPVRGEMLPTPDKA